MREAARTAVKRGIEKYEKGLFAEALAEFERAETLFSAPVNRVYMARTQVKLGKLLAARDLYDEVLARPVSADVTARKVSEAARDELRTLVHRIPALQIRVTGVAVDQATVTVDGTRVRGAALDRVEVDPGEHRVAIDAPRAPSESRLVSVVEGQVEHVDFRVVPIVKELPWYVEKKPYYASIGVAAAGIGLGVAFGIAAIADASAVKGHCAASHCPPSEQGAATTAGTLADLSTVAFVIGGIGAASTVAIFVLRGRNASATQVETKVGLGLGRASLEATF